MATTPEAGAQDPSVLRQIERQNAALTTRPQLSAAPSVTGTSGTPTGNVNNNLRALAPVVNGADTLYPLSTTTTTSNGIIINSTVNNDSGDITTVYSTSGVVSSTAINQTINQYTAVDSGVSQILAGAGITVSSTGPDGKGVVTVTSSSGNIGNIAVLNLDGNISNVLHGDGSWSADQTTYSNSNVVSLLSAFGSNTITTTGNISAGNVSATTFTGALTGNATGSAATVTTNAQPNITSVGTLTSLTVSGNISGGNLVTGGEVVANGNVSSGTGLTTGGFLSVNGNADLHNTTVTGYANVNGTANTVGGGATVGVRSILAIDSAFGSNNANDPASAQAVRGRVTGNNLTKTRNYVAGVTGQYLVTGTNASEFINTGLLGVVGDQTTTANAAVVAYLDGDGGLTTAGSAYGVSMKNSTPGSGFDYGLDLQFIDLNVAGTTTPFKQADIRFNNGVELVANTANNISINANVTVGNITANNLGNISSINIDGSNSNVLYGNGVFAAVAGGNANTGNVTFNDINIIGTGNLKLQPDSANASAYLDIFLTAGPDIHIAGNGETVILGTDNFANVAVNVDGNVSIQAGDANGTHTWTLDTTGNLTLPGNTFAVNYANGTQVSIGGGGNTGNVTFDDNIVIGTGDEFGDAGLYLAVGPDSIANGTVQYLRVRGGDAPTHIHLDTGNNQFYDQYFGDDTKYVKLELGDAGNVVVGTVDANGNPYSWSFTSDGNLILADGNSVIQSIANSSLDTLNPNVSTMVLTPDSGYNSQALVLDPTGPGHIHLRAPGANIDEPSANLFLGGEDTAFEITEGANNQAVIHSNGKAWTFGNDGNISSDTLTFTTTFANVKTVEYQTAGVWDLYVEDGITGSNTASSRLNVSFKDNLIDQPQVYIENTKESDGIALRWTFDENGNLNFPRDVAGNTDPYLNIFGGSTPTIQSTDVSLAGPANLAIQSDYLNLSGSTGNRIAIYADNGEIGTEANMVLYTNLGDPGNIVSWILDTTGNLTLPNTSSVLANVSITLEANDTGNITGLNLIGDSNANLYAHGNVTIVSDSSNTTATWAFDATGNLTLPGNLVIAGNTSIFGTDAALIQTTDNRPLLALSSGANGAVSSLWVEDIGNVGTSNIAAVYANPTSGSKIVRIAVGQNGGGGPNLWDFGTTGILTLPQGSQISETANTSVNITANANTWAFGVDGNLTVPGSMINDTSIVLSAPAVFNICTIATAGSGYNTGSSLKATTGGSGTGMTVGIGYGLSNQLTSVSVVNPGTGYVNGDVITVSEGTGGTFVITKYNVLANQTNNNTVQTDLIFANNTVTLPIYGELATDASMTLTTNLANTGNTRSWTFGDDGNLTIPGTSGGFIKTASNASIGIAAMDNGTNNPAQLLSINVGNSNATSIISAYATNATIQTNASGNINTWAFDNAGNLTLPANTFAINYANGTQVSLGGGNVTWAQIEDKAGNSGPTIITLGQNAGFDGQGNAAIAIGKNAGAGGQGASSITIGEDAGGNITQGANSVAIGRSAGFDGQGIGAVAIGSGAGSNTQGNQSVAIGENAGVIQGSTAVAIGQNAGGGVALQGDDAVAIGHGAGSNAQGTQSVAIGLYAGQTTQGVNAIAIGANAGITSQGNNSIILNATGANLNQTTANTFTVSPVRNDTSNIAEVMFYNATSKEVTYGNTISVAGNITGANFIGNLANGNSDVSIPAANGNINFDVAGNANVVVMTGTGANITGTLNVTGNITGNTNGFAIGYLNIPQVAAANATLALTDAGKHYYSTTAGNFTLTIPTNANVAFATGTAISIVVQAAGNILVNADTGVTLYMAGNSTAANRAVGGYGMATLMKVGTDTWFINGTGVA